MIPVFLRSGAGCLLLLVLTVCLCVWILKGSNQIPPHLIFIYADDLGWNDVSYHGSSEIPTPNIDALAMSGIVLNNYYGYWMCTPSRAALLTGKNPIRLGLQHHVLRPGEAGGLPLNEITLPQYLKKLGYANHMIGKWHLGYMTKNYTPIFRGFDSFFGYWNGNMDYFSHVKYGDTGLKAVPYFQGLDLHDGIEIAKNYTGRYATELFTEKAEEIIRHHDSSKPLFLYFAHMAVHTANAYMPHQAPLKYVKRVQHIKDTDRRIFAATALAMDDSVGQVFKALHDKGMLENSIIAFVSDNGGDTSKITAGVGSNFPLRGLKLTLWEGGNRVPALIWSPLFKLREPRVLEQLMHVTDWLPTFYRAAGGKVNDIKDIDGIDVWDVLTNNLPSPRKQILYNIDPVVGTSALREGDMKVINGSNGENSWYNPTRQDCLNSNLSNPCDFKNSSVIQEILTQSGWWTMKDSESWRKQVSVYCSQPPPLDGGSCNPLEKPCLFNVTSDPCEYYDLAASYPQVVDKLMEIIHNYEKTAVPPQSKPSDFRANPACHDFSHVPWLEPEHYHECTEYL